MTNPMKLMNYIGLYTVTLTGLGIKKSTRRLIKTRRRRRRYAMNTCLHHAMF